MAGHLGFDGLGLDIGRGLELSAGFRAALGRDDGWLRGLLAGGRVAA
jgi:hypothetical protein